MFDTTGQAMQFLHVMVPSTSTIVSISTNPSGSDIAMSSFMKRPNNPSVPLFARLFLNVGDSIRKFRARRHGVNYMYWFLQSNKKDLDLISQYVEEGKMKPVVGLVVDMMNIEDVRKACGMIYSGKGAIGKTIFEVSKL